VQYKTSLRGRVTVDPLSSVAVPLLRRPPRAGEVGIASSSPTAGLPPPTTADVRKDGRAPLMSEGIPGVGGDLRADDVGKREVRWGGRGSATRFAGSLLDLSALARSRREDGSRAHHQMKRGDDRRLKKHRRVGPTRR
jgi:hypothetical protein